MTRYTFAARLKPRFALGVLLCLICLVTCPVYCIETHTMRIVSLAPAMTEVLFAIGAGDEVVARTTQCDYPPAALALPAAGGFDGKSISLERVIAFRPSLVCGAGGMHDWLASALKPLGITLYLSRAATVKEVMDEIEELGRITGHEEGAKKTVHTMAETLGKVNISCSALPVKAYWEVWSSPLMAAGSSSFLNDMLSLSGALNIFSDIPAAYPAVSAEAVLRRNPAVIILSYDVYANKDAALNALRGRPGWGSIDAVKNGNIILLDSTAVRAGPRVADAVRLLAREINDSIM